MEVIRGDQVYFSSSNVSTDTAAIIKDQMLNEKFTFRFKVIAKLSLKMSHAAKLKFTKYKTHAIKEFLLK